MGGSGLTELFCGGLEGGAGGRDIIKKKVNGGGVDGEVTGEGVGGVGLFFTSVLVGTDLGSVFGANKKGLDSVATQAGELAGKVKGMIKATGADMVSGGRERNNDDWARGGGNWMRGRSDWTRGNGGFVRESV